MHLSDLHFGRVDDQVPPALARSIRHLKPDLLVVSGDLTQNGRVREFMEAREWLKKLPEPQLIVPGNHDMAFWNPWRRATQRLGLFRQFITEDREPYIEDDEIAVLGLNSARAALWRGGRISGNQVARLEEIFSRAPSGIIRVLVTHHPFDLPTRFSGRELIGRRLFARVAGVTDILLAGHMHISHSGPTAERHKIAGHSAIFVQAGTALSTRMRGEVNSFQVIRTETGRISVSQHAWDEGKREFSCLATRRFHRSPSGWRHARDEGEAEILREPEPLIVPG